MNSIFLQLLHEDGRRGMHTGIKIHIFIVFFPEIPQKITDFKYNAADWR